VDSIRLNSTDSAHTSRPLTCEPLKLDHGALTFKGLTAAVP
jgi:hypothetical protein